MLHVGEEDGHVDNVGKRGALGLEDHIDAILGDEGERQVRPGNSLEQRWLTISWNDPVKNTGN